MGPGPGHEIMGPGPGHGIMGPGPGHGTMGPGPGHGTLGPVPGHGTLGHGLLFRFSELLRALGPERNMTGLILYECVNEV